MRNVLSRSLKRSCRIARSEAQIRIGKNIPKPRNNSIIKENLKNLNQEYDHLNVNKNKVYVNYLDNNSKGIMPLLNNITNNIHHLGLKRNDFSIDYSESTIKERSCLEIPKITNSDKVKYNNDRDYNIDHEKATVSRRLNFEDIVSSKQLETAFDISPMNKDGLKEFEFPSNSIKTENENCKSSAKDDNKFFTSDIRITDDHASNTFTAKMSHDSYKFKDEYDSGLVLNSEASHSLLLESLDFCKENRRLSTIKKTDIYASIDTYQDFFHVLGGKFSTNERQIVLLDTSSKSKSKDLSVDISINSKYSDYKSDISQVLSNCTSKSEISHNSCEFDIEKEKNHTHNFTKKTLLENEMKY